MNLVKSYQLFVKKYLAPLWYRIVGINPSFFLKFYSSIQLPEYCHLRAQLLKNATKKLSALMCGVKFNQNIMINSDGSVYVESNGIFLYTGKTNRYFKVSEQIQGNEGGRLLEVLKKYNIKPLNIADIGANFGEISLFFAKNCENVRILSIEASSQNFQILTKNINNQIFDTSGITAVNMAVSDKTGKISISKDLNAGNSIILDERNERVTQIKYDTEQINCDTLSNIAEKHNCLDLDFIKIDIEGAEPLLTGDLIKLKPKAMFIEYSNKNTLDNNLKMIKALMEHYYCYDADNNIKFDKFDDVETHMQQCWEQKDLDSDGTYLIGTDLWFTNKHLDCS